MKFNNGPEFSDKPLTKGWYVRGLAGRQLLGSGDSKATTIFQLRRDYRWLRFELLRLSDV